MDDNEFGSDGCLLLAAAISSSTPSSPEAGGLISFKFLSVCCCEITGKGAVTLARLVKHTVVQFNPHHQSFKFKTSFSFHVIVIGIGL
jgi:hypothetical protein